jgi:hypothetical protein
MCTIGQDFMYRHAPSKWFRVYGENKKSPLWEEGCATKVITWFKVIALSLPWKSLPPLNA